MDQSCLPSSLSVTKVEPDAIVTPMRNLDAIPIPNPDVTPVPNPILTPVPNPYVTPVPKPPISVPCSSPMLASHSFVSLLN